MFTPDQIDQIYNRAGAAIDRGGAAMTSGDFKNGVKYYKEAIAELHKLENHPQIEDELIEENLANAYFDLSVCTIRICNNRVNETVHALIDAFRYGFRESGVFQNLLYCTNIVNINMFLRFKYIPDNQTNRDFALWHNAGYHLLTTPSPEARDTTVRYWKSASERFMGAIDRNPESAASFHGLGLAYGGMGNNDDQAFKAWLQVKRLDPDYNFEYLIKFRLGAKN